MERRDFLKLTPYALAALGIYGLSRLDPQRRDIKPTVQPELLFVRTPEAFLAAMDFVYGSLENETMPLKGKMSEPGGTRYRFLVGNRELNQIKDYQLSRSNLGGKDIKRIEMRTLTVGQDENYTMFEFENGLLKRNIINNLSYSEIDTEVWSQKGLELSSDFSVLKYQDYDKTISDLNDIYKKIHSTRTK